MSNEDEAVADAYVEAVRSGDVGGYAIGRYELARLLAVVLEISDRRLSLLRTLQRAVPRPSDGEADSPTGELKELLTNVFIMQSRLDGRDRQLVGLLRKATEADGKGDVEVDAGSVRDLASTLVAAYRHIDRR